MDLGFPEIAVVLAIALVVFGPGRLPQLAESMGRAVRGFKEGMKDEPASPEQIESR